MSRRDDGKLGLSAGRLKWYEFTQREVIVRPFYVRATSLKEARQRVREDSVGSFCGVPDYPPDGPHDLTIVGPGRLANQVEAQDMADERGWDGDPLLGERGDRGPDAAS